MLEDHQIAGEFMLIFRKDDRPVRSGINGTVRPTGHIFPGMKIGWTAHGSEVFSKKTRAGRIIAGEGKVETVGDGRVGSVHLGRLIPGNQRLIGSASKEK